MSELCTLHKQIQNPRWCRGEARIENGYIVLDKKSAQLYKLVAAEQYEELPFRLARLIRVNSKGVEIFDKRQAARFVKDYGMLWSGPKNLTGGEFRESVNNWRRAAMKLRYIIQLYETRYKAVRKALVGAIDEEDDRSEEVRLVRKALRALRDVDGST